MTPSDSSFAPSPKDPPLRVGIISLYGWLRLWDNYGTLLQNYALQQHLRSRGIETTWIRTTALRSHASGARVLAKRAFDGLRVLGRPLRRLIRGRSFPERIAEFNRRHPRRFDEFMDRWVPRTAREYTLEELRASPPAVDALIAGSDQVWREVTPVNFLDFGPTMVRRIAYAVSAPWPSLSEDWLASAQREVTRFTAISVRETDGLAVLQRLGRGDAVQAVDPTLLLDGEHYRKLVQEARDAIPPHGSYVLAYFVNVNALPQIPWEATLEYARGRGQSLAVVPLQGTELVIPPEYLFMPTPSQWLHALDRSEAVLTNSFHGALFAVIFRRPFLVFQQTGSTSAENCRFTSALEPLGLADRIVPAEEWRGFGSADIAHRLNAPIDWLAVEERLGAMRERSVRFLSVALGLPQ